METKILSKAFNFENDEYNVSVNITVTKKETESYLIDMYGKPYIEDESWPAGGGLDKRCGDDNEIALLAYYLMSSREKVNRYLANKGFEIISQDDCRDEWCKCKGNTIIVLDGYEGTYENGMYGYLHTEYLVQK